MRFNNQKRWNMNGKNNSDLKERAEAMIKKLDKTIEELKEVAVS